MIQGDTMYSSDEVIAKLGEVGYDVASAGGTEGSQTFRCSAYWEMGKGAAHRTGYIAWRDVYEMDDGEILQLSERTVLEFTEDK